MEENSPYQASRAAPVTTSTRTDWRDEAPREITSPIRHMWFLLALMGALTAIASIAVLVASGMFKPALLGPILFAAAVYGLLAYGVYKRSRIVATLILVFCLLAALAAAINIATGQGSLSGIGFLAIIVFVSFRGTVGTFRYHRHMEGVRRRPARTRLSDDPAFAPKVDTGF